MRNAPAFMKKIHPGDGCTYLQLRIIDGSNNKICAEIQGGVTGVKLF